MSQKKKATVRAAEERYVRWRNDGPRVHERVEFDDGHVVVDWIPTKVVSLPERFTAECEKLKLKRLGYARN